MPRSAYLSGPMTSLPDNGEALFTAAATDLRERGWIVHNPFEVPEGDTWAECLRLDLLMMLSADPDCLVMLPGWELSPGAALEVTVATTLGKPLLRYPNLEPIARAEYA